MKKECPVGEKLHQEYLLDGHCSHCNTSTPQSSWEDRFDELASSWFVGAQAEKMWKELKDFIRIVEQESYERGQQRLHFHYSLSAKAPYMKINGKEYVLKDAVAQAKAEERDALRKEYTAIFAWLLGEKGDFPDLSQKPHYSFRTELRQRLSHLEANK